MVVRLSVWRLWCKYLRSAVFERLSCHGNGVPLARPFAHELSMHSMPCCCVSMVNLAVIICARSVEASV